MIGFYDYTVIMTYISVVSSMIGILLCCDGPYFSSGVLSCIFRTVRYV